MEQPTRHRALSNQFKSPGKPGNGTAGVADRWHRFHLRRVEQLRNAILGANLDVMQMEGPRLNGRLAYAATNGLIASAGLIEGKVALRGPLLEDTLTLLAFLKASPDTHLAFVPVDVGDVALLPPGAILDAQFGQGTLYFAVALAKRRFASEALREGGVPDRLLAAFSGVRRMTLGSDVADGMATHLENSLGDHDFSDGTPKAIAAPLIHAAVKYLGLLSSDPVPPTHDKHAGIVERARVHMENSLSSAISVPAIADAAGASTRTLYRAFSDILGTTPNDYLRLVRLNRIRQELVSDTRQGKSVSTIAREFGINDLGRMSGWYRSLFGENPSRTLTWFRSIHHNRFL